jgi:hypothetical protein
MAPACERWAITQVDRLFGPGWKRYPSMCLAAEKRRAALRLLAKLCQASQPSARDSRLTTDWLRSLVAAAHNEQAGILTKRKWERCIRSWPPAEAVRVVVVACTAAIQRAIRRRLLRDGLGILHGVIPLLPGRCRWLLHGPFRNQFVASDSRAPPPGG